MDYELQRRALDEFDAITAIPADERADWIRRSYSAEPALRDAVMKLFSTAGMTPLMPTEPPSPSEPSARDSRMPARIGPFRPIALIGEGGMGRVYRAERADGHFEQTVAIKVRSARLFSGAAAEQFRVERQILAKLEHPHIARLLDGGVSDDGVSYIVMELVQGLPIVAYANAFDLDVRARLRLLLDVCSAVQYAHQQLVAHADIKPNNILVDSVGGVKLLDFGIAALVTDGPGSLGLAPRARTAGWCSPQIAQGARPTPSDDVFALGILLGELALRGEIGDTDLTAIAERATAFEPIERYASADALALDIQRWLDNRPVAAKRAGRMRRVRLFCRRNRLPVALGTVTGLALIAALGIMTLLYLKAEAAQREVQRRFEEVRTQARFMLGDVTDQLELVPGTSRLRRELAVRGRSYLETLSRIPDAPIDVRVETAEGYAKSGAILGNNAGANAGDPVAGRAALARADHDLTALAKLLPERMDIQFELVRALTLEATVAANSFNDNRTASGFLNRADKLLDGLAAHSADPVAIGWLRWGTRIPRANIYDNEARFAEMIPLLKRALKEGRALPVPKEHAIDRPTEEGATLRLLGDAQTYLDMTNEALRSYEAAADVTEKGRLRYKSAKLFDRAALSDYDVASTLGLLGRYKEALVWSDRGMAVIEALRMFDDSPRTLHIYYMVQIERAVELGELHRYGEAIPLMEANVADRRRLAMNQPDNYEVRRAVPVALRPLASLYLDAGRISDGCRTIQQTKVAWAELAAKGGMGKFDQSDEMAEIDKIAKRCPAPRRPMAKH